jgi:hypothetical protein
MDAVFAAKGEYRFEFLKITAMSLPPLQKNDFDFSGKISVDTKNTGFDDDELKKIDDGSQDDQGTRGAKGFNWNFWKKDRAVLPGTENLKSEFGYKSELYLLNLQDLAEAEGKPLEGQLKVMSKNFDFYVMPCGVYIQPNDGEKFEVLKFQVEYKQAGVSTYSMFPEPQQNTVFEVGGQVNLGITAKWLQMQMRLLKPNLSFPLIMNIKRRK